ncbi:MAG: hypothetical protein HY318_10455 [Armatimonadetes bacterium]|nr:hypothetical protein [Armatimonadota bacterium]
MAARQICGIAVLCTFLLMRWTAAVCAEGTAKSFVVKETSLGPRPPKLDQFSIVLSPDSRRIAYLRAEKGKKPLIVSPDLREIADPESSKGKESLVVDGKPGRFYDEVELVSFSPDSRRVAYAASEGDASFVVVDRVEGRKFTVKGDVGEKEEGGEEENENDTPGIRSISFSPDSQRCAYVVCEGGQCFLMCDGLEGKKYKDISCFAFSPDSRHLAYIAKRALKQFVVIDDNEGIEYDAVIGDFMDDFNLGQTRLTELQHVGWAPDGRRLNYSARLGKQWMIIVDKVSKDAESADRTDYEFRARDISNMGGNTTFSPDGKRFAHHANMGNGWAVVVDGVQGKTYDDIESSTVIFSPDSARVAYIAHKGKKVVAVVDGEEGPTFDELLLMQSRITFSPNGKRVAYVAVRGKKAIVIIDGVAGPPYDVVWDVAFTPDSRRLVYWAVLGKKCFPVVDGTRGEGYDLIIPTTLTFSPSGDRYALVAARSGKAFVVVDGVKGRPYDGVQACSFSFSPDGRHYAYNALLGKKHVLVVDGTEDGKHNDDLPDGVRTVFDSANSFHTIAARGKEMLLLETTIAEDSNE